MIRSARAGRRSAPPVLTLVLVLVLVRCSAPPAAEALNPVKPICSLAGLVSPLAGKVCSTAAHPGHLLGAGKQLLGGHLGGALESLTGQGASSVAKGAAAAAGIAAIGAWVTGGAKFALHETASVISATTRPELQSTWFSSAYWRMAGISALLTLPFLFAAAIQAIVRSDLALLVRAALGYLPLAMLAVSVAAPVTTLLLAASDQMSAIVSSASGGASGSFLAHASAFVGFLSAASRSPFLAFFVGLITAAATLTLWIELLIRSAAVYVIVLLLPVFFAALVWPARRVWAVRAVELLVALILSKFAIVAVLALGGAALGHTTIPSVTGTLAGATLVGLAAFSPWALLRMLPLHELAGGAAGGLRSQAAAVPDAANRGMNSSDAAQESARDVQQRLQESRDMTAAQAAVDRLAADPGRAMTPEPSPGPGPGPGGGAAAGAGAGAGSASSSAAPPFPGGGSTPPPSGTGAAANRDTPPQRSPGMSEYFQAPDMSLPELMLDHRAQWRTSPPVTDPKATATGGAVSDEERASDGSVPGELHDPLPPRQGPGEGGL